MEAHLHRRPAKPLILLLGGLCALLLLIGVMVLWPVGERGGAAVEGTPSTAAPAELAPGAASSHVGQQVYASVAGPWSRPLPVQVLSQKDVHAVVEQTRNMDASGIPALRDAALRAQDISVASNAIRALSRLGAIAGDAELQALVDDDRPRVRHEAVIALGQSGDASAVGLLTPLLESQDATLRNLALQALGRLGGGVAERHLRAVLEDPGAPALERALARDALAGGEERGTSRSASLSTRRAVPSVQ